MLTNNKGVIVMWNIEGKIFILGEKPHQFPAKSTDYNYSIAVNNNFVDTYKPNEFEHRGINAILEFNGSLDEKNYEYGFFSDEKDTCSFMNNHQLYNMVMEFLTLKNKDMQISYLSRYSINI